METPSSTRATVERSSALPEDGAFRTLFEKAVDAIAVSQEGAHVFVNPAYVSMFGYDSADELLGRPVLDVVAPASRDEVAERIERRARGLEVPSRYEVRGLRRDGSEFDYEVNVSVFDLDGAHQTLVIIRDITERKEAQRQLMAAALERQKAEVTLRERELLLRSVIDANPNLILVKDRNGAILLANRALAATYDSDIKEIVGQSHLELHRRLGMGVDEVEKWLADDREVIDSATAINLVEPFTHHDGTHHWYNARKVPLTLAGGRACVLIVAADISDQKRAEDRIRQLNVELEMRVRERTAALAFANKELEAFSYSISHDLRSPLRAIDGFALMIREDHASKLDDEGLRLLQLISKNTSKMAELIDDLLQFSRLARTNMESERVCMQELVQSVIDDLRPLEPRREICFDLGRLPDALGDRAMLRQVWMNLLANALKFTGRAKASAHIQLGGSVDGFEATYFVRDNGVGFDAKYAHKLFQVFQRLHRTEEFDGTGVGLAIVQRIIQRHGGRVWAEGKINHGATFYFALPIKRA